MVRRTFIKFATFAGLASCTKIFLVESDDTFREANDYNWSDSSISGSVSGSIDSGVTGSMEFEMTGSCLSGSHEQSGSYCWTGSYDQTGSYCWPGSI